MVKQEVVRLFCPECVRKANEVVDDFIEKNNIKGVKDDPEIVIKSPEHNVISSIIYMNFPHAKNAMKRAKQKEGETEMEFLIRKYASGPFGSTIHQKYYSRKYKKMVEPGPNLKINGQINLSAAANKSSKFIIVEE